jgi:hypothetical protein
MARSGSPSLDRPLARGLALLLCVGCIALLVWIEREQLFPSEAAAGPDDPAQACIAERSGQIDRMLAEGVIEPAQAELFKSRAAAMCQDTVGGGGGGPGLPLPPAQ